MKYTNPVNQKKKVVIYSRVSTDEQAEMGYSLANQEETLRRECTRRGYQVVTHFQDDGYSATNFKRPAFQQLLAYLKRHKKEIQYVFVTKWCRFSRNLENTILMSREMRQYGTQIITMDDGEESDNPAAFLLQMLNMTLPEIDNRIRSRNTRAGVVRALKEGQYPFGASPKGYSKDRSCPKTPMLVPNEDAELIREAFEAFETGLFSIEDVRKASWKNGLRLGRTQFGLLLRNTIYIGKILVPESKDEEAHLVDGVHEGIVSEKTFLNVQRILNRRRETNTHLSSKEKLREEFPLRGYLVCYKCQKNWTGSKSSGNGGKYPYYHCDRTCKTRVNAIDANEKFLGYLNSLQPTEEIVSLYMAMMEVTFKAKEGGRDQHIKKLKEQVLKHEQNLFKFDQQRYIDEILEADSYKRLKTHTQDQIEKLQLKIMDLEVTDTAFEKYCRFGMSMITHLDSYFQEAPLEIKRKMLGSIFPGKLTFEDGKYRTNGMNPALAIILQKTSGLQKQKSGRGVISNEPSADVPMTGFEPAPSCLE